jgi:hypothetical protein
LAQFRDLAARAGESELALRAALGDKSHLVVAKAAEMIGMAKLASLAGELEKALVRLLAAGAGADKGCQAKLAIARALYELGEVSEEPLLTGVRYVQKEWSGGGPVDTAALLRGQCGMALVRIGYRHALEELAELIMDDEPQTRIMAARAIGYAGRPEGALVLRVKLRAGDEDSTVMGECCASLVQLIGGRALGPLARLLEGEGVVAQEAALAIASLKSAEAFAALKGRWESCMRLEVREMLAVPMAMVRVPETVEFLLQAVRQAPEELASAVVEAMGMYRNDAGISERVEKGVAGRGVAVQRAFAKAFARQAGPR